jgi:hypothetical protein
MAHVHKGCLGRWQQQKLKNQSVCSVCRQPWLIHCQEPVELLHTIKYIASTVLPPALLLLLTRLVPAGSRRYYMLSAVIRIATPIVNWGVVIAACYAIYEMRYALEMQRFETQQAFAAQTDNSSMPLWWQAGSPLEWL